MQNRILAAVLSMGVFAGCSSIVSKSDYPVTVNSNPGGATFVITNKAGMKVQSGVTPSTVTLKSSSGYFQGESYTIELKKDGYDAKVYTITSSLDGWYFGNILLGGIVGMLIVDPATGAMYNLPERVDISLAQSVVGSVESNVLSIATLDSLTMKQRSRLQKITD